MNIFKKILKTLVLPFELISGFSKGSLSLALRKIDDKNPLSWEFSVFSNGGEDGILDYLFDKIKNKTFTFLEIGSANGVNNNTAYLAIFKKFSGVMIEGDKFNSWLSKMVYRKYNSAVLSVNAFVSLNNIFELTKAFPPRDLDVLSIDIDGVDYFILEYILNNGFKPKIIIVEYNANYGPDRKICVPYKSDFNYSKEHPTRLYYGVSLNGWKILLSKFKYKFITVDSCGVNAFFVLSGEVDMNFIEFPAESGFRDNIYERSFYNMDYNARFKLIADCEYHEIS